MKTLMDTVLNDDDIIGLYFARDEYAIQATDHKYGERLKHFLLRFLQQKEDREEVLSDTYLDTWNAIPPEKPRILYAFLMTLSRRRAIDRLRKMTAKSQVPESALLPISELEGILPDESDVEDLMVQKELARILGQFVKKLPKRQQIIFLGRYYAFKTVREISRELDVSTSTVEKTLKSLREDLKRLLEKEGYL